MKITNFRSGIVALPADEPLADAAEKMERTNRPARLAIARQRHNLTAERLSLC